MTRVLHKQKILPNLMIWRRLHLCLMPWLAWAAGAAGAQEILKDGLDRYCLDCHDSESRKGDLDLESMLAADLGQQIDRWERVVSK